MLSKKAKYALKALEYLARQEKDIPVHISEISTQQKIPRKFLEVILLELNRAGILQSKKGKAGGYLLLKKPEEIYIGSVIRLFDGPLALTHCVSYKYYQRCEECVDEATCGIRNLMQELREATNKILSKTSLANILKREKKLIQSLIEN
ncbi:MAG: Rrf2 family transcriptional regulator [Bacteroidetes bacterium]|nr:Rrf2 family transcriptional regulator [Bacteroidota bacterium]